MEFSGPRNIDKSLYLSSDSAKTCPLCGVCYVRMVSHFKTMHSNSEIFVSRISPQMVDQLDNSTLSYIKYAKQTGKYLQATCIFCEKERNFSGYYWTDHIRSHSGEYANVCILCQKSVCFNNHCGMNTDRKVVHDLFNDDLYAYLCTECNYVQLNEKNLLNHLERQHNFSDFSSRYRQIKVLPSFNSLPLKPNPNTLAGAGKWISRKCFE